MKNIALITAKGSNTSLPNKNLIPINGTTFLGMQIAAAQHAQYIDAVFVSTECPLIRAEAEKHGALIINRPNQLAQQFTNHGDVILHGAKVAQTLLQEEIGIVTVLLGNTALTRSEDIDKSIEILMENPDADSAMTVWQAQDDHPYRAMKVSPEGYLETFLTMEHVDTNRQSYPNVFYYDQGPWSVRFKTILKAKPDNPVLPCWWWMGEKSIPIIRNWVTGKDVHTQLDVHIAELWVKNTLWSV